MNRYLSFSLILLFLLCLLPETGATQQPYRDLWDGLTASYHLSGDQGPENLIWIDDGDRYSYNYYNPETGVQEIRIHDPASGRDQLAFSPEGLTFPSGDIPFQYESFEWSADFTHILFRTNVRPVWRYSGIADYYLYSLREEVLTPVADSAFTAELSPDGEKVGYGKNGELFVLNLKSGRHQQLTHDAGEDLYNGRFGWVYEEEFGKVQAWEWSPDSRQIAYWQSDERHVKPFVSTDYEGTYPEYTDLPYPKVGEENPTVRVGIVDIQSGDNHWLDVEQGDGYIPRIYWTARTDELAVAHLNREQNHLTLFLADSKTGRVEPIFEETSTTGWIDLFDFFSGADDHLYFPTGREEFFWLSDRDGWQHLYRHNYQGELINQVTHGPWEVSYVHRIDPEEETIWYESTEPSPLERHLYSIDFDGSEKQRYSREPGRHHFDLSPNGKWYLDRWSRTDTPTQVELWTTDNGGERTKTLSENSSVSRFIEQTAYAPHELFRFTTSDGRKLDGVLIRPTNFDPEKNYPVLLDIYGGPGSQGVFNEFSTDGWRQYLAQQGYVVVDINNRGSSGYGYDFEKMIYKNLGHPESEDYAEAIRWLGEQHGWIDTSRVAIRGHSYGGYLAALASVLYPDTFRAAISAAPVTDWRLYDTIYAERYMGLLEENRDGYINSSVMAHAEHLRAALLVAHSSMDENVHLQNTMQMVRAFTDQGIDVDLRIYPPGNHGIAYNRESYHLLYKVYTNHLNRHLEPE